MSTVHSLAITGLLLMSVAIPTLGQPFLPSRLASVDSAYAHLYYVMDKYHKTFDVYTDQDAGGNHFFPTGWMGNISALTYDGVCTIYPHLGTTCIKINFLGGTWAGIYWQYTEKNWGDTCNVGYDLTGADSLTFYARCEKKGELVEFFTGGMGIGHPCPDSSPKKSSGWIALDTAWKRYTINLQNTNLSYVIGGFGFTTNGNQKTFYIDDIQYHKKRLDSVRFLQSFESVYYPKDTTIINPAFIYDNALAMLVFMADSEVNSSDWTRAKLIGDAFIYCMNNDITFSDGRLRNAYQSGDVADRQTGKVRLPGWWDYKQLKWLQLEYGVGSYTGNLAWVITALLQYYKVKGGASYLDAATKLAQWIFNNTYDSIGAGGYTGGFDMKDATLKKITWKSTEHNIAVYSAFMKLFDVTNASIWRDRAFHARDFAEAMWDTNGGHFWTGTMDDGVQINKWVYPLDVNTLGLIFLGGMYAPGIEWAYKNCLVNTCPHGDPFKGFDFNDDIDGVWPEGSAQMCVSFCMMNDTSRYGEYIQQLRLMQSLAKHNNGKGIVEACHDTVTSGFEGINKINRLSVAATSWYIFAEQPCAKLTNIFSESNIPIVYSLSQNYPNPLSPSTTITYQLPKASPVTLELYNVIGQRVKILVDEWQHAGQYSIQWDGKNSSGFHIANGVYYYRIVAGSFVDTKSAILIR